MQSLICRFSTTPCLPPLKNSRSFKKHGRGSGRNYGICKTAVENRGSLTDEEIEKLENYFERLNELTQQELDMQQQKAESIKQIAVDEANTYEGSLEDYQALSQNGSKPRKNNMMHRCSWQNKTRLSSSLC